MSFKPIKLFSHASGPNPWKVAMVLEELEIPYETEYMDFAVLHTPVFEKYNPNGR
jgi:glutathione S-transferase